MSSREELHSHHLCPLWLSVSSQAADPVCLLCSFHAESIRPSCTTEGLCWQPELFFACYSNMCNPCGLSGGHSACVKGCHFFPCSAQGPSLLRVCLTQSSANGLCGQEVVFVVGVLRLLIFTSCQIFIIVVK